MRLLIYAMAREPKNSTDPLLIETLQGFRADIQALGKKIDDHSEKFEARIDGQETRLVSLEAWRTEWEDRRGRRETGLRWLIGLLSGLASALATHFLPSPHNGR